MSQCSDISELAISAWRLEKWIDKLENDRKMAAKSALRGIKKYISGIGVEVIDPIGSKFDPGLAVEVVNNESENAEECDLFIVETLSPYVYHNGELIKHARVIIGIQTHTALSESNIREKNNEEISDKFTDSDISDDEMERILKYAKIL